MLQGGFCSLLLSIFAFRGQQVEFKKIATKASPYYFQEAVRPPCVARVHHVQHGRQIRVWPPCSYTVDHVLTWQSWSLNSPEDPNLVRLMSMAAKYALTLAAGPNLVRVTSMAVKYALNAAVGPNLVRVTRMAWYNRLDFSRRHFKILAVLAQL